MGQVAFKINSDLDKSNIGTRDTLQNSVCSLIVEHKYESAIHLLNDYLDKENVYPNFKSRAEKYIAHAVDLVHAIKSKRNFPGAQSLTSAKQQELSEKYKQHFEELKFTLKKVEKIKIELRNEDLRSTAWVIKALIMSIFVIAVCAFLFEIYRGLASTGIYVIQDIMDKMANWFCDLIGL